MSSTVVHRGHKRKGKGYTAGEVVEAGLTVQEFARLGLIWDSRRKSKYDANVNQLKELKKNLPPAKPKKAKKKAAKLAPKNE